MSWNYRVMKRTRPDEEEYFEVIEAYYDKDGKVSGWIETGIFSETPEGLTWQLNTMAKSLEKALLDEETIMGSK